MKKYFIISFLLLHSINQQSIAFQVNLEAETVLEVVHSLYRQYSKATYLLSLQRSGNTWLRYCIEFLTHRPTLVRRLSFEQFNKEWFTVKAKKLDIPLVFHFDLPTDLTKTPVFKVHEASMVRRIRKQHQATDDKLILIVRNPKESLLTLKCYKPDETRKSIDYFQDFEVLFRQYIFDLILYHEWSPEHRHIVYYEDLMERPAYTLNALCDFLAEGHENIQSLINNIDKHKQCTISLYEHVATYNPPNAKKNDLLLHSKKISAHERRLIDQAIEKAYPTIWHAYLQERYSEKSLYSQGLYT